MSILASWCSVKLEYLLSVTSVCLISTFKGSMQNKMCVSARVSISECVSSISLSFGNVWKTFFTILCKKMELQEEFVFISQSHLIISDRFNVDRSDSWLIVRVVWILWLCSGFSPRWQETETLIDIFRGFLTFYWPNDDPINENSRQIMRRWKEK